MPSQAERGLRRVKGPEFAISYPRAKARAADGRVINLVERDPQREPRTNVEANEPLQAPTVR